MEKIASFEIETSANREDCFKYLSNMENFGSWFPGVLAIVGKNKDSISVGKQYIEAVKVPLVGEKKVTLTVKEYDADSRFSTEGSMALLLPRMEIFVSNSSKDQVKITWSFYSRNSNGYFKIIAPLFRAVMGKRAKNASENLKAVLASIEKQEH